MNPRIGIITALSAEYTTLKQGRYSNDGAHYINAGIGAERAAAAAARLIEEGVSHLLSWGFAGALVETLRPGDVLLATSVTDTTGNTIDIQSSWHEAIYQRITNQVPSATGLLLQSDAIITLPADKSRWHARTQALAVDMESMAIAQVAHAHARPFMAVRAIVDGPKDRLPSSLIRSTTENGMIQILRAIRGILSHPSDLPSAIRLGKNMRRAQKNLMRTRQLIGDNYAID